MADDITLTVRVRDMTQGEFSQIRQRMRGMDRDITQVGQSSSLTSQRTDRLRQSVQGVSQRMEELHRTGRAANHEMTYMRQTMSLLGRDLADAARSGEVSQEEFRRLRGELQGTRLDFDYLSREVQRHNAIAQRESRETAAAERAALQQSIRDAREAMTVRQRMGRAETAAYREEARRQAAAQRDALNEGIRNARINMAQRQMMMRSETAAYREEARRQAAAQREAARASAPQGSSNFAQRLTRLTRSLNTAGLTRTETGFRSLQTRLDSVTGRMRHVARGAALMSGGLAHVSRGVRVADDQLLRFAGNGLARAENGMRSMARRSPLMAIGLTLLGSVAQLAGAALTVALGGAFVGLGAYALKGSAQVKDAFQEMKSAIGSTVRDAAAPLAGPLAAGLREVGVAAQALGPLLRQAFVATGPLVSDLFGAITGLLSSALPGMVASLQSMGPIMAGFRTALTLLGEGISNLYSMMSNSSVAEGLGQVWHTVGNELKTTLDVIGQSISDMAKSGAATLALIGVFRALNTVIILITGVFDTLDTITFGAFKHLTDWITGVKNLATGSDAGAKSLGGLQKQLAAVNKEIADQQAKKAAADDLSSGWSLTPQKQAEQLTEFDQGKLTSLLAKKKDLQEQVTTATNKQTAANSRLTKSLNDVVAAMKAHNDMMRGTLDAQSAMEAAIDSTAEMVKKHGDALKIVNDQVDLNSKKAREAYDALSTLAGATQEAATKATASGKSWEYVKGTYDRGRAALIKMADQMGLTKGEAKTLADQILGMPSVTAFIKGNMKDLQTKLEKAQTDLKKANGAKATAKVRANIDQLQHQLFLAARQLDRLNGKTAVTYVVTEMTKTKTTKGSVYHEGGNYSAAGGYIEGEGTGTSDSIPAHLSNGEFVINAAATKRSRRLLEAINSGKVLKFASGGAVGSAARNEIGSSMGISYWGKKIGHKVNPFVSSLTGQSSLGDLAGSLNKWQALIKKAASGGVEKMLLKGLNKAGTALIKNETKLLSVNSALEKAKTKLTDLKDAAAQLKETVTSGIISGANITGSAQDTGLTSTGKILDQLTQDRDKASALSGALKELKSRGLNSQSLSEIAQAGVSGGGLATASALMSASAGDIEQINSLESQLKASAAASGKITADAVYGASIKSADKIVKGLEKSRASLEKSMSKLANGLEKLLAKALGIKGHASGGAAGGWTKINERGAELVHLPNGSTVYPTGQSRQMVSSQGGSSAPIVIHLDIGNKPFEQIWVDTGRRAVRTRGGNVQVALGRPGS